VSEPNAENFVNITFTAMHCHDLLSSYFCAG